MEIRYTLTKIKLNSKIKEPYGSVRGFFSRFLNKDILGHNHISKGTYFYDYPRIQYKFVDNVIYILELEKGGRFKPVLDKISAVYLGSNIYDIISYKILDLTSELKVLDKKQNYIFVTPWLPLNKENLTKYMQAETSSFKKLIKQDILQSVLIGNLLSLSKSLGLIVNKDIRANLKVKSIETFYKNIKFIGFVGFFSVNFQIPDFFGIGKGASKGFGTILSSSSPFLGDFFEHFNFNRK